ncbi:hypothetical protein ANCCAN_28588, partial [Ancylostoma caninum]
LFLNKFRCKEKKTDSVRGPLIDRLQYVPESEDTLANISSFDDVIVTVQHLAHLESGRHDALQGQCHLWKYTESRKQMLRFCCEMLTLLAVVIRTTKDVVDMQQIGLKRWWIAISAFPEKVLHKAAQLILLLIVPVRTACFVHPVMLLLDNVMTIAVVLMTTMHFLFYCRGMKFVGPFVLMVYKIIVGDMLRFLLIYSVFILGFAQVRTPYQLPDMMFELHSRSTLTRGPRPSMVLHGDLLA